VKVEGVVAHCHLLASRDLANFKFDLSDTGLLVAVKATSQPGIDQAHGGELARRMPMSTVRVRGKVEKYEGSVAAWHGRPIIWVTSADQLELVDAPPPSKLPATNPTSRPANASINPGSGS
jgi:hypothetical protein